MEIKDLQKENEISLGALGMGVQQVGSGGITEETDPTVPQWAKEPNKPTYTYDEITEKPTLVEEIGSSIEENTNKLTIELKDKDGNVLAISKVKLPSTQIDVDTELSDTSTNPVENQAVTEGLGEKLNIPEGMTGIGFIRYNATKKLSEKIGYYQSDPGAGGGNIPLSKIRGRIATNTPEDPLDCVNKEYFDKAKGTKFWQHTISFDGPGFYFPIIAITLSDTLFTVNENNYIELPNVGDGSDTDRLKNLVSCYCSQITADTDVRVKISKADTNGPLILSGYTAYSDFVDTVTEL